MIIECTTGMTRQVILSAPYEFELDEFGRAVCEVHEQIHIDCILANPVYREATETPDEDELQDLEARHEKYAARFFPELSNDNEPALEPEPKPDKMPLPNRNRPGRKPKRG